MEKINDIKFNVTGHTKIWHKEAGKVYDDPRGELVTDSKNAITSVLRNDLATALVATNAGNFMGANGYVTDAADSTALNTNLLGGNVASINTKSGIIIGNSAIGTNSTTIHAMNTGVSGTGNSRKFTGVFTKTGATDVTFNSAAVVQTLGSSVANPVPLESAFPASTLATQTSPTFSRLMKQNDTLTIEWTITIN
jgi:hypothetical protein